MKEALKVWQSFYCEGAYRRCERYKLVTNGMKVPEKLLPNGRLVSEPDEPPQKLEPAPEAATLIVR